MVHGTVGPYPPNRGTIAAVRRVDAKVYRNVVEDLVCLAEQLHDVRHLSADHLLEDIGKARPQSHDIEADKARILTGEPLLELLRQASAMGSAFRSSTHVAECKPVYTLRRSGAGAAYLSPAAVRRTGSGGFVAVRLERGTLPTRGRWDHNRRRCAIAWVRRLKLRRVRVVTVAIDDDEEVRECACGCRAPFVARKTSGRKYFRRKHKEIARKARLGDGKKALSANSPSQGA